MHMLNKRLVEKRFGRRLQCYREEAVVQRKMAGRLADMVVAALPRRHVSRVLEVGAGSGMLTRELLSRLSVQWYAANDLVPEAGRMVEAEAERSGTELSEFIAGDIESLTLDLPGDLDLIVSGATLQWLQDLPALFRRMAGLLKPGGVLAFSTFGPENMKEIRQLESVGLHYQTLDDLTRMASGWFDPVSEDVERHRLSFETPEAVLHHIRYTGVNGVDGGRPWTRGRYRAFIDRYYRSFPAVDGVRLTYHALYCCLRKRAE